MREISNRYFLLVLLFLTSLIYISAQSTHEELETLLNSKAVTTGQLARFVLNASESLDAQDNNRAFNFAKEKKWLPEDSKIDDPASMETAAYLFLKAFDIKGGLFYSLAEDYFASFAPHYAYRELVNMKVIQGTVTPNMTVSGEQLLFMTSRLLAEKENQ